MTTIEARVPTQAKRATTPAAGKTGKAGSKATGPSTHPAANKAETSEELHTARVTKHDHILTLLSRRQGATVPEMMEASGWQQHSVRGAELARLEALTNFELRGEWRRLHVMQPPTSLSRELLLRGITYKIQERAFGGLSKSILRKLSGALPEVVSPGAGRNAPRVSVKVGTRLVREWNGQTHTVLVHADGVEWRGKRYRSLSVVAHEITGAHWSGPRFFGLSVKRDPLD